MNIGWCGFYEGNFGDDLFYNIWKDVFVGHNIVNLYEQVSDVDKIIIGGGGLIKQSDFDKTIFKKEFLNYPTYIYGMGVNDASALNDCVIIKYNEYLNQCKRIYLRESIEFLDCNKEYVEDMIWSMDLPDLCMIKDNIMGLSLNTVFYNEEFFHFCNNVIAYGMNIYIIDLFIHTSNKMLYDRLYAIHGDRIQYIQYNRNEPLKIMNVISSLRFYVTQKLHGFIIAMMYRVPSICIGGMNKYNIIRDKLKFKYTFIDDINILYSSFRSNLKIKHDFSYVKNLQNRSKLNIENFKQMILND